MAEIKFLNKNVVEASKDRIRLLIDMFDEICVSYSGGKDSLVVLKLVEQIFSEQKITKKINVLFYDEELIPDNVLQMIDKIIKNTDKRYPVFSYKKLK